MASKLGKIILDAVLPADSTGLDLSAIATGESLDKLVKGALAVIAEHPDLMGIDNPGIERIVQETVTELASQTQKIGPDLFPDIAFVGVQPVDIIAEAVFGDFCEPSKKERSSISAGKNP